MFNSWDRQPFLTDVGQAAPKPDLNPSYNTIARNFFIGNYGASQPPHCITVLGAGPPSLL